MSYIPPEMVTSPKAMVSKVEVLKDFGKGSYSVARLLWDGNPSVGVRWNGGDAAGSFQGLGNPQSRGIPTWFVLPKPLADLVLKNIETLTSK